MNERESADARLFEHCRTVVEHLLGRYGWQLLGGEELARRVVDLLMSGEITDARTAAMHAFCLRLYRACSGAEGSERQTTAWTDLQRYLYQLSFGEQAALAADLRWEVINETLMRIWLKFERCRKPAAFLAFAAFELHNALRPWWRRGVPTVRFAEADDTPSTDSDTDPSEHALSDELRQLVHRSFETSLQRHPRAKQQLEAVWLKYIRGLDDAAISAYLDKPIASVQVLRSRGLERLRTEPGWQRIAREFGIGE